MMRQSKTGERESDSKRYRLQRSNRSSRAEKSDYAHSTMMEKPSLEALSSPTGDGRGNKQRGWLMDEHKATTVMEGDTAKTRHAQPQPLGNHERNVCAPGASSDSRERGRSTARVQTR